MGQAPWLLWPKVDHHHEHLKGTGAAERSARTHWRVGVYPLTCMCGGMLLSGKNPVTAELSCFVHVQKCVPHFICWRKHISIRSFRNKSKRHVKYLFYAVRLRGWWGGPVEVNLRTHLILYVQIGLYQALVDDALMHSLRLGNEMWLLTQNPTIRVLDFDSVYLSSWSMP